MNLSAAVALLSLVAPTLVLASPSHAAGTGCTSESRTLEHQVLVKKKPVLTQKGQRFGTLRLFGGEEYVQSSPGGAPGGYLPTLCLDLVLADAFRDRAPKIHGQVSLDGGSQVWYLAGRARTGILASGGGSTLEGRSIAVLFVVDGKTIQARRVMRATYPEIG